MWLTNHCRDTLVRWRELLGSIFKILYRRLVPRLGAQQNYRGCCTPPVPADLDCFT